MEIVASTELVSVSNVFVVFHYLLWKAKLDLSALSEGLDSWSINVSCSTGSIASCGVMKTPSCIIHTLASLSMEMSRLTRDGTAEPVSRDLILRHARGQRSIHFPCPAVHEQDWQPYPVDPYSAICDDHTYIHTYMQPSSPEWSSR